MKVSDFLTAIRCPSKDLPESVLNRRVTVYVAKDDIVDGFSMEKKAFAPLKEQDTLTTEEHRLLQYLNSIKNEDEELRIYLGIESIILNYKSPHATFFWRNI